MSLNTNDQLLYYFTRLMNEFFRLDDSEFNVWQSKFISYVEGKCRGWVVSMDKVQVLIIHQSNWATLYNNSQQNLEQEISVVRFVERSKYQKMIEKFVLCLIDNNENAKTDLETKIVEWIVEAQKEASINV